MSAHISQSKSSAPFQGSAKQKKVSSNPKNTSEANHQRAFKYICFILIAISLFCIPYVQEFRRYCQRVGYFMFPLESLKWCAAGFFFSPAIKYSFNYFCQPKIQQIVHPKYTKNPQILKRKTKFILKLTYDTFFFALATLSGYILFSNEDFFPSAIGGEGSCAAIYKVYPNWPKGDQVRLKMTIYFMFQLGVRTFSVFQLIFIAGLKEYKFYETLLHHCITVSLVLFSMMINQITAGLIIIIIHDASDILLAGLRAYAETKFQKKYFIMTPAVFMLFFTWFYLRIILFPFCLLSNAFINRPTEKDEWFMIYWVYMYLMTMTFILYCMHLYWTYYMVKSSLKYVLKKELGDQQKRQEQD